MSDAPVSGGLHRRLGGTDAVMIGLGSMIGAGIFAALGPAAGAAGPGLLIGLLIAAVVAYCNATSSARLAAEHPVSGGTYVYGSRQLGPFWGYLAGWGFIVGKTASCAAMALTIGAYAWPDHARAVGVAAVAAVTAINYAGVQKSARASGVIVLVVISVLTVVVAAVILGGAADPSNLHVDRSVSAGGVLQAAGLLFFAFAGYARMATLGEEVVDPVRTIPRAIRTALVIALAVYAAVAVTVLAALGAHELATSPAPVAEAARLSGADWLVPVVGVTATLAAVGALLSLLLGVSRTTLAMARDRHLPAVLSAVHQRRGIPHHAELAVGTAVAVLAATVDLRGAIGFSSFAVLVYYAIANISAWTLPTRRWHLRAVPVAGFLGCVLLAFALPRESVIAGIAVLIAGAAMYFVTVIRRGSAPAR